MKRKNRNFIVGYFFLFLQLVIIMVNVGAPLDIFFWFCNHAPLFFAVAFFINRSDIAKGILNIGLLGQFLWAVDLFFLLLGFEIFGFTSYVFEKSGYLGVFPILIHVFSTSVALLFTYDVKPEGKVLVYSGFYVAVMYVSTLVFTNESSNVNCLYSVCGIESFAFFWYIYLWPVLFFVLLVLPAHFLQYFLWKWSLKRDVKMNCSC